MSRSLPVLPLIEDVLVVGETRAFSPPSIAPATIQALKVDARVCAITVGSLVELPSFVAGRWAIEARVVAIEGEQVTIEGAARVRVVSARGSDGAFRADVEAQSETVDPKALARGALSLVAALDAGALPLKPGHDRQLVDGIAAIARATADLDLMKTVAAEPLPQAAERVAKAIAARASGERASAEIEAMIVEAQKTLEVPKATKQRLWGQTVEILKRLDVYDATTSDDQSDVTKLQRKVMQAGLSKEARGVAKRELRLLRTMKGDHHDYSNYVAHLEFMAQLPWHADPLPPVDLDKVAAALDREHAGLDKPKRRLLEYLAVRALGGSAGATILCLAGPPGVGKTTLARAMADALGRKFVRVALGGVHDECEIRGFRKSFVAASAGRLLTGIAQAGSMNAVVLLDEIDKLGTDNARSPAGALHEVLDPEQNPHFQDNYLGCPYDLSNALFVCTANDTSAIAPTLLDRLELIELEGYSAEEKAKITRAHLLGRLAKQHGLEDAIGIEDDAIDAIIEGHTREAGVRQLSRALASVLRARSLTLFREVGKAGEAKAREEARRPIERKEVEAALGAPKFTRTARPEALPIGVATGLSVGADGGAILFVEAGAIDGSGKLRMTGRLGEVLQESAQAALHHLRIDPSRYGLDAKALGRSFHVHLPEGATPKDGPSAGVALAVAFASVAKQTPVRADVAFTGEITLTGRVLSVGGVRAKVLAAERAGMKTVIVPKGCAVDVPSQVRAKVVEIERLEEAFAIAFDETAKQPAKRSAAR